MNEETWNKMKHEIERDYNEYNREFRKRQETRRHVETVKEMRNRLGLTWTGRAAHKTGDSGTVHQVPRVHQASP